MSQELIKSDLQDQGIEVKINQNDIIDILIVEKIKQFETTAAETKEAAFALIKEFKELTDRAIQDFLSKDITIVQKRFINSKYFYYDYIELRNTNSKVYVDYASTGEYISGKLLVTYKELKKIGGKEYVSVEDFEKELTIPGYVAFKKKAEAHNNKVDKLLKSYPSYYSESSLARSMKAEFNKKLLSTMDANFKKKLKSTFKIEL